MSLATEYRRIQKLPSRQARGIALESLVESLFERGGFDARRNARIATPRQTDLHAHGHGLELLVEVKWRGKPAGTPEIDALRSRIGRTAATVIGCLISVVGFNESAEKEVLRDRRREIVLLSGEELEALFDGRLELRTLLREKHRALRRDAEVYFAQVPPDRYAAAEVGTARWISADGRRLRTIVSTEADVLFAPEILHRETFSHELTLDLTRGGRLSSLDDLRTLLRRTVSRFGATGQGAFAIQQVGTSWHGHGLSTFFTEAARMRARYAEAKLERPHHSEELVYVDEAPGMLVHLSIQRRIAGSARFHHGELTLLLEGLPVDTGPYVNLCERVGQPDALFRTTHDTAIVARSTSIGPLTVRARLVHEDKRRGERSVAGIVVDNPFVGKPLPEGLAREEHSALDRFTEPSLLVCSLRDWHGVEDDRGPYYLIELRAMWGPSCPILAPIASWKETRRRR